MHVKNRFKDYIISITAVQNERDKISSRRTTHEDISKNLLSITTLLNAELQSAQREMVSEVGT